MRLLKVPIYHLPTFSEYNVSDPVLAYFLFVSIPSKPKNPQKLPRHLLPSGGLQRGSLGEGVAPDPLTPPPRRQGLPPVRWVLPGEAERTLCWSRSLGCGTCLETERESLNARV